jgi:hypothetical protein
MYSCLQREVEVEVRGGGLAAIVSLAGAFGLGIWGTLGGEKAAEYFTGYILEQSLSIDNLFVFILIFKYFKTPKEDEDKVRRQPDFRQTSGVLYSLLY